MSFVRRFVARTRTRGSSDLTVTLLLTAAGAAMVGMTAPSLFKSSDTASKTFDKQVQILERGANGGSGAGGGGGSVPSFDMGSPGSITGTRGNTNLSQGTNSLAQSNTGISQSQGGLAGSNTGVTQGQGTISQGNSGLTPSGSKPSK
jgi:hypothetical protein